MARLLWLRQVHWLQLGWIHSCMQAMWAHPGTFRHLAQGGTEAARVPTSLTRIAQQHVCFSVREAANLHMGGWLADAPRPRSGTQATTPIRVLPPYSKLKQLAAKRRRAPTCGECDRNETKQGS